MSIVFGQKVVKFLGVWKEREIAKPSCRDGAFAIHACATCGRMSVGDSIQTRTLLLGLGNPLLSDDGVGRRIEEKCAMRLRAAGASHINIDFHAGGGLSLMERLAGYDCAIIVDAINTSENPSGTVSFFRLEDLPARAASHLASTHETTLQTALQMGRMMQVHLR